MNRQEGRPIPLLAEMLLAVIASREHRDFVLGDLQEEFEKRHHRPSVQSHLWYWKEVARAVPGLVLIRLRSAGFRIAALSTLMTMAAYLILFLWGLYVIRPIMIGILDNFPVTQEIDYAFIYLPVRMLGMLLVAAAIAFFAFRSNLSFIQNFRRWFLLLLLLVTVPPVWTMLIGTDAGSGIDPILKMAIDCVALYAGAQLGSWIGRYKPTK